MGLDNPLHIAFLVVILLLVFGARRLPEIGRSLGSGMREFKDSISGDSEKPSLTAANEPQAQTQAPAAQAPVTAAPAQAPVAQAPPAEPQAPQPDPAAPPAAEPQLRP